MSEQDRIRWDERYEAGGMASIDEFGPPPVFAAHVDVLPNSGVALELACGRGRAGVWLARRGLDYRGFDVSPVAVDLARQLAAEAGVGDHCRFDVHDLDLGLPDSPAADLIFIYLFRNPDLDSPVVHRLGPGGVLATACLSEVGAGPGNFRAQPGELVGAFADLDIAEAGEAEGMAWLIARK